MGSAFSSAARVSEAPAYGSLEALGARKPKKTPVLVLDPEELARAHQLFQDDAAERLADMDRDDRPPRAPAVLGLVPLTAEEKAAVETEGSAEADAALPSPLLLWLPEDEPAEPGPDDAELALPDTAEPAPEQDEPATIAPATGEAMPPEAAAQPDPAPPAVPSALSHLRARVTLQRRGAEGAGEPAPGAVPLLPLATIAGAAPAQEPVAVSLEPAGPETIAAAGAGDDDGDAGADAVAATPSFTVTEAAPANDASGDAPLDLGDDGDVAPTPSPASPASAPDDDVLDLAMLPAMPEPAPDAAEAAAPPFAQPPEPESAAGTDSAGPGWDIPAPAAPLEEDWWRETTPLPHAAPASHPADAPAWDDGQDAALPAGFGEPANQNSLRARLVREEATIAHPHPSWWQRVKARLARLLGR